MTVFSADDRWLAWRCAKILLANEWTVRIRGAVYGERIISIVKVHNARLPGGDPGGGRAPGTYARACTCGVCCTTCSDMRVVACSSGTLYSHKNSKIACKFCAKLRKVYYSFACKLHIAYMQFCAEVAYATCMHI